MSKGYARLARICTQQSPGLHNDAHSAILVRCRRLRCSIRVVSCIDHGTRRLCASGNGERDELGECAEWTYVVGYCRRHLGRDGTFVRCWFQEHDRTLGGHLRRSGLCDLDRDYHTGGSLEAAGYDRSLNPTTIPFVPSPCNVIGSIHSIHSTSQEIPVRPHEYGRTGIPFLLPFPFDLRLRCSGIQSTLRAAG